MQDLLKQALQQNKPVLYFLNYILIAIIHLSAQVPLEVFFCGVTVSFFIIIGGISLEITFHSFPQA